jgi:hypothetical protein
LHPIIRETVYADIATGKRSVLHEQAADLILDAGGDSERAAAHLHRIEPRQREKHVACLRAAAQTALARGAPGSAARHLRRALQDVDGREARRDLLAELGWAETSAQLASAPERFWEAMYLADSGAERVELVRGLIHSLTLGNRIDDAIAVATEELEQPHMPGSARLRLEADLAGVLTYGSGEQLKELDARLDRLRPDMEGGSAAQRDLQAAMAHRLVQRGEDGTHARAMAERLALESTAESPMLGGVTDTSVSNALMDTGALDILGKVAKDRLQQARALGAPFPVAASLSFLSIAEYRQGNLARAEATSYECLGL